MKSVVKELGSVTSPLHTMERVYMKEFRKETGLPSELKRWQPTIDQMLLEVDTDGPIYLMIDQGLVKANSTHRRKGVHIDGYWIPEVQAHGGAPGGHIFAKNKGYWDGDYWNTNPKTLDWPDEALILASSVSASAAYVGEWDGVIKDGGDCSHLDLSNLQRLALEANKVYAGNVTMLHESTPVMEDVLRSLVRLSVPGWSPK
jgi:hypothetical protein